MLLIIKQLLHKNKKEAVFWDSLIHWRDFFTDPYLQELIEKGLAQNTDVQTASLRVEKAKHLLENTNTKVIDIALEVGFDTLPYFSSVFKKYTGLSPAEFRKRE